MRGIYIGLGTNLSDRVGNYIRAREELAASPLIQFMRTSSLYRSEPWGMAEQPWFLNAVLEIETSLPPDDLLAELKRIEQDMGRMPSDVHWGPRLIDLDIILYGDMVMDSPTLRIPHPYCTERLFVLIPLVELDKNLVHPRSGKLFRTYLKELRKNQTAKSCFRLGPKA